MREFSDGRKYEDLSKVSARVGEHVVSAVYDPADRFSSLLATT
jgi:hypothetical protein